MRPCSYSYSLSVQVVCLSTLATRVPPPRPSSTPSSRLAFPLVEENVCRAVRLVAEDVAAADLCDVLVVDAQPASARVQHIARVVAAADLLASSRFGKIQAEAISILIDEKSASRNSMPSVQYSSFKPNGLAALLLSRKPESSGGLNGCAERRLNWR